MKIEINNKDLEVKLTEIAQSKYMTLELFLSGVLREIVEEYSESPLEVDHTISGIRKESDRISEEINTKLKLFEDKYEVKASLSEVTETQPCQIIPKRYRLKVTL